MGKFRCKKCNYCFAIEQEKVPKVCPNCGELEVLSKEITAEELVGDSNL